MLYYLKKGKGKKSMNTYLILIARYSPLFVKQDLFLDIEKNLAQFGIWSQAAYRVFQENKSAQNSLYFHHSYAQSEIPIGQEYDAIAYGKNYKIQSDSILKCQSKILCFFTAYKTQPSDHTIRGHHELSLIQFNSGIPPLVKELYEIKERKPIPVSAQNHIYLGSENKLRELVEEQKEKSY